MRTYRENRRGIVIDAFFLLQCDKVVEERRHLLVLQYGPVASHLLDDLFPLVFVPLKTSSGGVDPFRAVAKIGCALAIRKFSWARDTGRHHVS